MLWTAARTDAGWPAPIRHDLSRALVRFDFLSPRVAARHRDVRSDRCLALADDALAVTQSQYRVDRFLCVEQCDLLILRHRFDRVILLEKQCHLVECRVDLL